MNTLFKDLTPGSIIYALVKGDELIYHEGTIVSVGNQRIDVPKIDGSNYTTVQQSYRHVVDVTYSIDGKNYTDAVDVTANMFPTDKIGFLSLIATDKEPIVRELHATLNQSDNYIKTAEKELPKQKKRIKECKALIAQLDVDFNNRQQLEERIKKIEDNNQKTTTLLEKILEKIEK